MTKSMASALGIGFGCLVWSLVSTLAGFPSWMGFVGCTAYFAAGAGKTGGIKALCSNWAGIFWAMAVILLYGTGIMQDGRVSLAGGALAVGFIAWIMTYQSKIDVLSNVPNTFMGCFATFAANGDWQTLMAGVTLGVGLGFLCDYSGKYLYSVSGRAESAGISGEDA